MKEKNRQIIVSVIIIIIFLFLNIYIYNSIKEMDCKKCVIGFKSKMGSQAFGDVRYNEIKVNGTDLYDSFVNGECIVIWEKDQGYMKNG